MVQVAINIIRSSTSLSEAPFDGEGKASTHASTGAVTVQFEGEASEDLL